jgi:hemolysin D
VGNDREFLPAALEILETPPSPIRMSLIVVICAFFFIALAWAYFSRIDIIAVAQGKLQPTGHVKVIQALETSRVLVTRVENGQQVHAGQVLVELDPSETAAAAAAVSADLNSSRAEILRRQAEIAAMRSQVPAVTLSLVWPDEIPVAIRQREERVYAADILQLNAQIASLTAEGEQKQAEQHRLKMMIAAENDLIGTLQQRVSMRLELVEMDLGKRSDLIDATEALQNQKTTLAEQQGELAEADANLVVLADDIQRVRDTFIADNTEKLGEAERQADDLVQRFIEAKSRLDHMTLRSPIDGTVQASTLTTVGQVVASGQELMRVVPIGAPLEIECYLRNEDIGFVKKGEHAVVKIESFPFTRYGTIGAEVTRVARDAIPEPDADQIERDPTRSFEDTSPGGGQRVQNLVFPLTLRPNQQTILVDGTEVPLGAGMAVTAEIRTGSRRILEYIFSPLMKIGSEAMKER